MTVSRTTSINACLSIAGVVALLAAWTPTDVARLRQQIEALDADTSALQQRLTALERGGAAGAQAPVDNRAFIVRAPFEVQDDNGKPIIRVVEKGAGSRGLYVFNAGSNVAAQLAVFTESGGGRVLAYPGTRGFGALAKARVGMYYESSGPIFEGVRPDDTNLFQVGSEGFIVYNKSGTPVAKLAASNSGAGYLQLANATGNAVVEAGQLEPGRGVVRAYPCCGPPPIPIPSFIVGKKAK